MVGEHQVAKHLKITYTAVKKVLDGKTSALTASNNARAAQLTSVRSDWLATGEGDMKAGASPGEMPFRELNVFEAQLITFFRLLTLDQQHEVVAALNKMVGGGASAANPFPGKARKVRGTSVLGELGKP